MHPTPTYAIIEDGRPMDGDLYTRDELLKVMRFADYDATIVAFDLGEIASSGTTPMRDVTEDMTIAWWDAEGQHETRERIAAGKSAPGLAERFYSEECAAYQQRVEAA